jgi:hypothetical protein
MVIEPQTNEVKLGGYLAKPPENGQAVKPKLKCSNKNKKLKWKLLKIKYIQKHCASPSGK